MNQLVISAVTSDRTESAPVTSAQYCCLVSESMCAKPPSTRAFIRDLCKELDSRWRGGLRRANCFARFHQLSHCTTMFALNDRKAERHVKQDLDFVLQIGIKRYPGAKYAPINFCQSSNFCFCLFIFSISLSLSLWQNELFK